MSEELYSIHSKNSGAETEIKLIAGNGHNFVLTNAAVGGTIQNFLNSV